MVDRYFESEFMVPDPDGTYVAYSDYAALLQSHARLLEALKAAHQTAKFEKHPFRVWHMDAETAIAAARQFEEK